jgi:CBS domain containing-hemolysin-like protein
VTEDALVQGAAGDWIPLAVAFAACLLGSCFFSFSETCLTSLSESRALALMGGGGRRVSVLRLWLDSPHEILTTILIGNNIANSLAAVLMAQLTMVVLGQIAIAWASGAMTILVLVFGEITPKTLARQHADRAAVPVLLVLRLLHLGLYPVTWIFVRIASLAVRLAGSELSGAQDVTESELRAMVDLARREGILDPTRARYLSAVFELKDRQVREIMVARPEIDALDLEVAPAELVRQADGSEHSRLPVFRGDVDEILGVLHSKDLLHLLATTDEQVSTRRLQLLLRQPIFVPEAMRLESVLAAFRESRQHLAVVLDEFGGTAGIVTLEDVLEELVGEIRDEHDDSEVEPALVPAGPGRWTAPGRLPLAELERDLGLNVPKEAGYETLAGLLMDVAGRVPEPGYSLEWQGWRFRVLTGDDRRIGLVRLEGRAARTER